MSFSRTEQIISGLLASFGPRIYTNMYTKLPEVYRWRNLAPNFVNSIYPAWSVNFGPQAVTVDYVDNGNDPCNWCHIVALGQYDPTKGGHIVLFDLKLAIEFPAGASVLIPSAILRHGNTSIQKGETRQAIIQYCPGGLLRWADAGFQTLKEYQENDPAGYARFQKELAGRAAVCVRRFSYITELEQDRASLRRCLLGSL